MRLDICMYLYYVLHVCMHVYVCMCAKRRLPQVQHTHGRLIWATPYRCVAVHRGPYMDATYYFESGRRFVYKPPSAHRPVTRSLDA